MTNAPPIPQHVLTASQLDDVELLGYGALGDASYGTAPDEVRLVTDPATAQRATAASRLELIDPEGAVVATVTVTNVEETGTGAAALIGTLTGSVTRDYGHFRRYFRSPADAQALGGTPAQAVLVDRVPSTSDLARLALSSDPLLLLVPAGANPAADVSPLALMRAAIAAKEVLPDAHVVAVPLARDGAGASAELSRRAWSAYAPHGLLALDGASPDPRLAALAEPRPGLDRRGLVLLFTGLSGSGKSTIARGVHDFLLEHTDRSVTSLDGDVVRRNLSAGLGFSPADRETNIRRIGWVAAEIARHGGLAMCSPIAPFAATREEMRRMALETGGSFVLVYVATPLDECERRDRKGMYAKARAGEITDFTGISSPYEEPDDADLRIDTSGRTIEDCVAEVIDLLSSRGLIRLLDER